MALVERTVGTGVGADHNTWRDAWVWLTGLGLLGADYDFIQVADTVEPAVGGWPSFAGTNGYTTRFICPFEDSHQGDPTRGFTTTLPVGSNALNAAFNTATGGAGVIEFNGLRILNGGTVDHLVALNNCNYNRNQTAILRNSLLDGQNVIASLGVTTGNDISRTRISNVKIYNCALSGYGSVGGTTGIPDPLQFENIVENMVVYNCGVGIRADRPWDWYTSFRNVVSCGNTTDWMLLSGATAGAPNFQWTYNCADSDGTLVNGDNILNNIVPADEFVSLDSTLSGKNFLWLPRGEAEMVITANPRRGKAPLPVNFTADVEYRPEGSLLAQTGSEPVYAGTEDMAGETRPGESGEYAIGCHEQQYDWIVPELEG